MAPLVGLAAVTFLSTLDTGQQCANTVHLSDPGASVAPDPTELADLADDLNAYFATTYRGVLRTVDTWDAIKVAQVPDPTISGDAYADYLLPLNLAGTRTAVDGACPREACACLSLKTNSGQRSYRGHLLLPSAGDIATLDGEVFKGGQAYITNVTAFANKLIDGCGASPVWTGSSLSQYTLSIYSRVKQMAAMPSVTGCITVVANTRVHWLRSRARGTT
jgi:hypothetical protein